MNKKHHCNRLIFCKRLFNDTVYITADNQLNAKPVVKQRHPGDEFPVSQRGSTKGKQSTNARV